MVLNKRSQEIHNAFVEYVKTGDKGLINNFTRNEIELTILQCSHHSKGWNYYEAMENRVAELKEQKKVKEKWVDMLIGFLFAIILVIIGFILNAIFPSPN